MAATTETTTTTASTEEALSPPLPSDMASPAAPPVQQADSPSVLTTGGKAHDEFNGDEEENEAIFAAMEAEMTDRVSRRASGMFVAPLEGDDEVSSLLREAETELELRHAAALAAPSAAEDRPPADVRPAASAAAATDMAATYGMLFGKVAAASANAGAANNVDLGALFNAAETKLTALADGTDRPDGRHKDDVHFAAMLLEVQAGVRQAQAAAAAARSTDLTEADEEEEEDDDDMPVAQTVPSGVSMTEPKGIERPSEAAARSTHLADGMEDDDNDVDVEPALQIAGQADLSDVADAGNADRPFETTATRSAELTEVDDDAVESVMHAVLSGHADLSDIEVTTEMGETAPTAEVAATCTSGAPPAEPSPEAGALPTVPTDVHATVTSAAHQLQTYMPASSVVSVTPHHGVLEKRHSVGVVDVIPETNAELQRDVERLQAERDDARVEIAELRIQMSGRTAEDATRRAALELELAKAQQALDTSHAAEAGLRAEVRHACAALLKAEACAEEALLAHEADCLRLAQAGEELQRLQIALAAAEESSATTERLAQESADAAETRVQEATAEAARLRDELARQQRDAAQTLARREAELAAEHSAAVSAIEEELSRARREHRAQLSDAQHALSNRDADLEEAKLDFDAQLAGLHAKVGTTPFSSPLLVYSFPYHSIEPLCFYISLSLSLALNGWSPFYLNRWNCI